MEKKKTNTLDKVVGVLLIIALIGAGIYFKDTISLFIGSKIQGLKVEEQVNGLQEKEDVSSWESPFYTTDGKEFGYQWHQWNCSTDSETALLKKAFEEADSNCIWFESTDFCQFYNIDDATLLSNVESAEKGSLSASDSNVLKNNEEAQKFLLRFNKSYKGKTDGSNMLEPPYDDSPNLNPWSDEQWAGLDVEAFYKEYKVVTKISNPVLKKIMVGTFTDTAYSEPVLASTPCMVFEFDITNISSDEHPLKWFPQAGETKTVQVLIQGGFDAQGQFCIKKGLIL